MISARAGAGIMIIILLVFLGLTVSYLILPNITGFNINFKLTLPEIKLEKTEGNKTVLPEGETEANKGFCTPETQWCLCNDKNGIPVKPNGGFCIPKDQKCEEFGRLIYDCVTP